MGSLCVAVIISLLGEDLLELSESNLTVTLELEVMGFSFGGIPLRVVAVSYDDFEMLRTMFGVNSTLEDVAAGMDIPDVSALASK